MAMESQPGEGMRNTLNPTDRSQNFFSGGHVLVIRSVISESRLAVQGDLKAVSSGAIEAIVLPEPLQWSKSAPPKVAVGSLWAR